MCLQSSGIVNSHPCNNSAHPIHKAVAAVEEYHSQNKSICSHQEYEPTFYLYLTCAAHKGCCINSKGPDKIGCNPRHLWILSPRNSKFISSFYRLHPLSCLGRVATRSVEATGDCLFCLPHVFPDCFCGTHKGKVIGKRAVTRKPTTLSSLRRCYHETGAT